MSSSSETFERFSRWKNSRTSLKVTVIERGQPEDVYSGRIDATDSDAEFVGICIGVKSYRTFEVTGSVFSIESDRVVVARDDVEWLIFEEED